MEKGQKHETQMFFFFLFFHQAAKTNYHLLYTGSKSKLSPSKFIFCDFRKLRAQKQRGKLALVSTCERLKLVFHFCVADSFLSKMEIY